MPGVEHRHLRVLLAVAEHGNLTRAAAALHVTQPVVSRTLRQLEDHVGRPLVTRSTHHAELTAEGQSFAARAAEIVAGFDDLVAPVPLPSSPVRLGHAWSALGDLTSALRQRWRAAHPATALEILRVDDRLAGVRDHRSDIGIVRGPVSAPEVWVEPLMSETRVAALPVGHPLAGRRSVTLDDLASEVIVVNTVSGTTTLALWPTRRRPERKLTVRNTDDWAAAIGSGDGVGVTVQATEVVHPHPEVVYVALSDAPPVAVSLAWPRRAPHPMIPDLVAIARELVAEARRDPGDASHA